MSVKPVIEYLYIDIQYTYSNKRLSIYFSPKSVTLDPPF